MRGVEVRLQQKGVMPLLGVHRQVNVRNIGLLQQTHEGGLLFGIEAVILVDTENEILVTCFTRAGKKIVRIDGVPVDDRIILAPHLADAQVGVRIKAIGELFPLMKHVAFHVIVSTIPGKAVLRLNDVLAGASLNRIEMHKGLVTDHPRQSEPGLRCPGFVVFAGLELRIIFNREDLLEKNDAIQNGGAHAGRNRDDNADPLWMSGRKTDATETAGGRPTTASN